MIRIASGKLPPNTIIAGTLVLDSRQYLYTVLSSFVAHNLPCPGRSLMVLRSLPLSMFLSCVALELLPWLVGKLVSAFISVSVTFEAHSKWIISGKTDPNSQSLSFNFSLFFLQFVSNIIPWLPMCSEILARVSLLLFCRFSSPFRDFHTTLKPMVPFDYHLTIRLI